MISSQKSLFYVFIIIRCQKYLKHDIVNVLKKLIPKIKNIIILFVRIIRIIWFLNLRFV